MRDDITGKLGGDARKEKKKNGEQKLNRRKK